MSFGFGFGFPRGANAAAFSPLSLFTGGVPGAWYDPSDLNNYMSGLGPELVAPIDFTTGWSSSGAAVTFDSAATFTAAGVANVFRSYFTVGVWYKMTFKATFTGSVLLYNANTAINAIGPNPVVSGTEYTFYFLAAATQLNIRATSASTVTINTISVKEVTSIGNATMFTDSAGTTPVTAVEQQVGLILDKSQGLVLGPELVTGGDFSSGASWTTETGWSVAGGVAVATNVASFAAIFQSASVVAGRMYLVTFTVSNYSAGQVYAYVGSVGFGSARSSNGTFTQYIFASGIGQVSLRGTNNFTGNIDNFSVRELPGNHAFQSTNNAFRPTLRSRLNLLTYSEQFDNVVWTKSNAFVQTNLLTYSTLAGAVAGTPGTAGPDWGIVSTGGNLTAVTADSNGNNILTFSSSAARVYFTRAYAVAANTTYTYSGTINSNTGILFYECLYILALPAGATMTFFANGVSVDALTYVPVANDRLSIVLSVAGTSGTVNVRIGAGVGGSVTGTVAISRPQLVQGAVPGDYRATYAAALPVLYPDPIGGTTAMKLSETQVTNIHLLQQNLATVGANQVISVYAKAGERTQMYMQVGTTGAYFNLATGAVISGATASITSMGNDWYRCSIAGLPVATNTNCFIGIANAGVNSYAGDGTSGIYIWGAQLAPGTTAQNYQRITTATDYDTVGFPLYLFFDGSNDTMQSNTITFSTKYMTCVTGDSRTNNAAQRILLELSANSSTNDGSFGVFSPFATTGSYGWQRDNTVTSDNITTAGYTTLTPYVGTGIIDFTANPEASFTVDTSYNVSALDTGASNFGNYPVYIGARAGTSLYFSGNIYQILFVNKLLSAAELVNLQYFVATKCGVAVPGTVPTTGPFYQTGPTLDLVFAGTSTDGIPGSGDSLMLDFTSPTYQVGSPYTVWEE